MKSYRAGQVLQLDLGDVGDGAQTVPLRALPLINWLSADGVPQVFSSFLSLLLVWVQETHNEQKSNKRGQQWRS